MTEHRLGDEEGAVQVYINDPAPLLLGAVQQGLTAYDAGVVEEGIHMAEVLDYSRHGGVHGGLGRYVALDAEDLVLAALEGLFQSLALQVQRADKTAFLHQTVGQAQAQAIGGAGDDADLAHIAMVLIVHDVSSSFKTL